MPSNSDSVALDLDRTDELPRLDVEAYEASLADREKGLARTDTWNVSALHEMDELAEARLDAARQDIAKGAENGTLTGNVDSILKRIADLEADVVAAHEANEALQEHSEALQADRDRLAALVQTLESENTRQREHRELAQAMTERAKRKLREELDQTKAQVDELQSHLARERQHAEAAQSAQQTKFEELTSESARLVAEHRSTEAELASTRGLLRERAEQVTSLDHRLHEQKELTDQVARQFAIKLADCERLSSLIETRDSMIAELIATQDALNERLHASDTKLTDARQELDLMRSSRAEDERRTRELSNALEKATCTIDSLREEVTVGHEQIATLTEERDALLPLKASLVERTEALEGRAAELEEARSELKAKHVALEESTALAQARGAELEALRSKLRDRTQAVRGLEQTLATRDELVEQLTTQLQTAQDEHAEMVSKLEKARRRVKALSQEVFTRDHRISELRTELMVHTEAMAAIRRDVNRIGHAEEEAEQSGEIERVLEPVDHAGPEIVLSGKLLTVGRTSESDVCIPSKLVSRNHARLLLGPTGVIIEDEGSTNGCYVNGKQVRKHLMRDGDVLELGDLRYRLQSRSTFSDTKVRAAVIPMFEPRTP